jgi:SNF2-related domain/Helicase conserved C-terminal domain/SWIM zinc finger
MSFKAKFSGQFKPKIRDRGHAYFRSHAVEILDHSESHVEALVQGTDDYRVRLSLNRSSLRVACTCPYFEGGENCKHLWATMLAADSAQHLTKIDSMPALPIVFDYDAVDEMVAHSHQSKIEKAPSKAKEPTPLWQQQLSQIGSVAAGIPNLSEAWSERREIFYVIDPGTSVAVGQLSIEIAYRQRKLKGDWSKLKSQRIPKAALPALKNATDREILAILSGVSGGYFPSYDYNYNSIPTRFNISTALQPKLLPLMCATGRCVLRSKNKSADVLPVQWDEGLPWSFWLVVERDATKSEYVVRAELRRTEERMSVSSVFLMTETILISADRRASNFSSAAARAWKFILRDTGELRVPDTQSNLLVAQLLGTPGDINLDLPQELQFETTRGTPSPHLIVRKSKYAQWGNSQLDVELVFDYEGVRIDSFDPRPGIYQPNQRRFVERDREAENQAFTLLGDLGFKTLHDYNTSKPSLQLAPTNLPRAVRTLIEDGWRVEAEGKLYRTAGSANFSVSSGIDWFELHGSLDFGDGLQVKLPALLTALRRGETMIPLSDGSFGLMPEEWLQKYGLLASVGEAEEDHLRFKQTQTGLLDALLAARPEITCDETFARVREDWRNFRGITAVAEPAGFVGTLREYQREGLGWFEFLQRFKFGGCLADDMGLGKTVQVLAMLESRRNGGTKKLKSAIDRSAPSLVVVPRSLIFNWQQEAARFAPKLRLLIHTGAERIKDSAHFENYDLIITTYGTLRRDAAYLQNIQFDYVILDEAQAIKNFKTESAKAARVLQAKHRLALSGTPVENHLGELWSLFEFLNPGMLGAASVFQLTSAARSPDEETRKLLSRALRPFILRRTKQQVAKELPEKLEQTIYCEMEETQRRQYNELRDFYRASLLERISSVGLKRAKIQILEALLRLRQAACHPALISADSDHNQPSAKLDLLMPQLAEVIEEGHKALVFSQFTSFLAIVRQRLEEQAIAYEYLDGKTRDRQTPVERFQNEPESKLFLISLKAGGQGLNLTAAEYVFLLDPWWNPAVEAQAIDRAHRIGQSRRVFAYRLITRDTVEEKVLALQATKRDLADAIINADNSVLKNITGEDLMALLT